MTPTTRKRSFFAGALALVAGGSLVLAACSSSSKSASTSTPTTAAPTAAAAPAAAPATPSSGSGSTVTVTTAQVPGVGTVLVDGDGRTLYLLTSEKGGMVTCTTANGCAKYWPPLALPAGASAGMAGPGVQTSLLSTAKSPTGGTVVTYGSWPLYTFIGDNQAGVANGEGMASFGGTWWAVSPTGTPVTKTAASPSSPSTTAGSTGGYGY